MPKAITDEYSSLPISTQRRYQLRHKRDGLCIRCQARAVNRDFCAIHAEQKYRWAQALRKRDPLRTRARNAVTIAIASGKLVRQKCEVPSCNRLGEAHHADYAKPLEVTWLCNRHHHEKHGHSSFHPKAEPFRTREMLLKYRNDRHKRLRETEKSCVLSQ